MRYFLIFIVEIIHQNRTSNIYPMSNVPYLRTFHFLLHPFSMLFLTAFTPPLFPPSSHAPPETQRSVFPPQACTFPVPAYRKYSDYRSRWRSPRSEGYGRYPGIPRYPPLPVPYTTGRLSASG